MIAADLLLLAAVGAGAAVVARAVLGGASSTASTGTTPVRVQPMPAVMGRPSSPRRWVGPNDEGEFAGRLDSKGEAIVVKWRQGLQPGQYWAAVTADVDHEPVAAAAAISIASSGLAVSRRPLGHGVFLVRVPGGFDVVIKPDPEHYKPGDYARINATIVLAPKK